MYMWGCQLQTSLRTMRRPRNTEPEPSTGSKDQVINPRDRTHYLSSCLWKGWSRQACRRSIMMFADDNTEIVCRWLDIDRQRDMVQCSFRCYAAIGGTEREREREMFLPAWVVGREPLIYVDIIKTSLHQLAFDFDSSHHSLLSSYSTTVQNLDISIECHADIP